MISILDRYIGRSVFVSTVLVFFIILGLFSIILFLDAVNDLGRGNFNMLALISYVLLNLPSRIYEIFPAVSLVGATVGLSLLALNSELIAMRAGGVSLASIIFSVLKVSSIFIVAGILLGEMVVPVIGEMAERGREQALKGVFTGHKADIWLRDGNETIRIGEVLPDLSLLDVAIYRFDDRARLQRQDRAKRARYIQGQWQLEDLYRSEIEDTQVRTHFYAKAPWPNGITPELISVFTVKPQVMPSWVLYRYILHLRQNQQDTASYELAFWNKVLLPVTTVIMVLLAIPFIFGDIRGGGMGQRVFIGVMLGLAYSLLQNGMGYFGLVYGVPPLVSAALPGTLFLLVALFLLRRFA